MNITRRQALYGLGGSGILASLGLQLGAETPSVSWQFAAVADTGKGNEGQYAVANAMNNYYKQNPYSLVLLAGDNIYGSGEIAKIQDVFEKPYASLLDRGVKFRAVLGNHDVITIMASMR